MHRQCKFKCERVALDASSQCRHCRNSRKTKIERVCARLGMLACQHRGGDQTLWFGGTGHSKEGIETIAILSVSLPKYHTESALKWHGKLDNNRRTCSLAV